MRAAQEILRDVVIFLADDHKQAAALHKIIEDGDQERLEKYIQWRESQRAAENN